MKIPIEVDSGFQGIQHISGKYPYPPEKGKGRAIKGATKIGKSETQKGQGGYVKTTKAGVKRDGALSQIYRNHAYGFGGQINVNSNCTRGTYTGWQHK